MIFSKLVNAKPVTQAPLQLQQFEKLVGLLHSTQPRSCDLNASVTSLFGAFSDPLDAQPNVFDDEEYVHRLVQLNLELPCV